MEIKRFFMENPLIRPSSIEKALGIPHGTIRLNSGRKIPEKYEAMIIESLERYSAIKVHRVESTEKIPEIVLKKPLGKEFIVKRVRRLSIGEHAYFFGKINSQGNFERDNDILDGASAILLDS
jgi:uncharacterized protein YlzI (FlbEa/FlbD family)